MCILEGHKNGKCPGTPMFYTAQFFSSCILNFSDGSPKLYCTQDLGKFLRFSALIRRNIKISYFSAISINHLDSSKK